MSLPLHKQVIARAYKLIEDPNRWTRFVEARNSFGAACKSGSEDAVQFCARGALYRAARDISPEGCAALFKTLTWSFPWIVLVNDLQGHAAVLKHFKKAQDT